MDLDFFLSVVYGYGYGYIIFIYDRIWILKNPIQIRSDAIPSDRECLAAIEEMVLHSWEKRAFVIKE